MGKGKEGAEQCVFLVQYDSGPEHVVFNVCTMLDRLEARISARSIHSRSTNAVNSGYR